MLAALSQPDRQGRLDEARAVVAKLRVIAERSAEARPRGPRALSVGPAAAVDRILQLAEIVRIG
jgi:hypothetical protein